MGEVYKGRDTRLDRTSRSKFCLARWLTIGTCGHASRARHEPSLLWTIPTICGIYDVGQRGSVALPRHAVSRRPDAGRAARERATLARADVEGSPLRSATPSTRRIATASLSRIKTGPTSADQGRLEAARFRAREVGARRRERFRCRHDAARYARPQKPRTDDSRNRQYMAPEQVEGKGRRRAERTSGRLGP